MKASPNIFRKYDIRGIYPTDLNNDTAYHVGRAFGTYLSKSGRSNCLIGRDNRHSSPEVSSHVIKGLIESGVNVTDVGIMLTPVVIYGTCELGYDSAVVITASHNPKQFSGIKLYTENATPYAGENLIDLYNVIDREDYVGGEGGVLQNENLLDHYIQTLKTKFAFKGNSKIIVECGGGPSAVVLPKVFKELEINATYLNDTLNSEFPQGSPDPENPVFMENLMKSVKEQEADIGIAVDTDGDRVGVVDKNGRMYRTDEILMLLSEDILIDYPGSEIIYDVKSSESLEKFIADRGGKPKMMKTGRSNFEEEMKNGAALGAEFAGHIYYAKDYYGFDDGIYAALKVLKIIEKKGLPLDQVMAGYPQRVSTSEIKIPIEDQLKDSAVNRIIHFVKNSNKFTKLITIDGIRAYISDTGWFLVRSSGTSPYLSARMEAKDNEEMVLVKELFEEAIQNIK